MSNDVLLRQPDTTYKWSETGLSRPKRTSRSSLTSLTIPGWNKLSRDHSLKQYHFFPLSNQSSTSSCKRSSHCGCGNRLILVINPYFPGGILLGLLSFHFCSCRLLVLVLFIALMFRGFRSICLIYGICHVEALLCPMRWL